MINLNLDKLRENLDIVDNEIFHLINKRLKIVKDIGILKSIKNIPYYIPDREKCILNRLIENNKNKYISNSTISYILNKIIYESYILETNNNYIYKNKKNNSINITFIGGSGKMGKIFKNMFIKHNYNVLEINSKDWGISKNKLINSNLIFICSPISKLDLVLKNIYKYITNECILLDISSIKDKSITKMLNMHSGPVLGLHPMFGPNVKNLIKQTLIYSDGRYPKKYKWILDQFKFWGINIYNLKSKKHDNYMSYAQSLRYINLLILGSFIMNKNINFKELIKISPPIYKIYLSILCKFFSGDINLYLDIIFSSKNNLNIFNEYINYMKNIYNIFNNYKNKDIVNIFNNVKLWLKNDIDKLSNINDFISENLIINNY